MKYSQLYSLSETEYARLLKVIDASSNKYNVIWLKDNVINENLLKNNKTAIIKKWNIYSNMIVMVIIFIYLWSVSAIKNNSRIEINRRYTGNNSIIFCMFISLFYFYINLISNNKE